MKRTLSLILALAMVFALVACGGKEETKTDNTPKVEVESGNSDALKQDTKVDEAKTYKKELTIGLPQPIVTLDPQTKMDNAHDSAFKMVYNQLVAFNFDTMGLEPELATSWTVEDPQNFTFKLREGVKFSNGEEFEADDVIYTFTERPGKVEGATSGAAIWNELESVTAVDKYTVHFTLNIADADFLYRLYLQPYSIFNREADEKDIASYVGTNGWVFDDFAASDYVVFTRFDESWVWAESGVSPTEKVTFRTMAEDSARAIAVQTGDLAAATKVAVNEVEMLKQDKNIETMVFDSEALTYFLFGMNENSPFADDPMLRKAVATAINRVDCQTYQMLGFGTIAESMWGKNQYALFTDFAEPIEYNVEKAKEYLAQSKHPEGVSFTLTTVAGWEGMATLMQAMVAQIGCEMKINITDSAGVTAAVKAGEIEMLIYNISLQTIGDRFHFIGNIKSSTNRASWDDPDLQAMFDEAKVEADDAKRTEMYKDIQNYIHDAYVYIPLYYEVHAIAWNNGVSGVQWTPDTKADFSHVMWEE